MRRSSNPPWPRVMRRHSVRVRRSVDRGCSGQVLSSEITHFGKPTLWTEGEGKTVYRARASGIPDPRSHKPCALTHTSYTEIGISRKRSMGVHHVARTRKTRDRTLVMHVFGKSDGGIVSKMQTNKGAQLPEGNQPPEELAERRPSAKRNSCQQTENTTQSVEASLSRLTRVREAAKLLRLTQGKSRMK